MSKTIAIYIVIKFGCDSSPSSLWVPETKIFTDEYEAYKYYYTVCPDLDDEYDEASRTNFENGESIIQLGGYHSGYGNRAKRPYGAKISREYITIE
jgi:hypothetical protein